LQDAYNIPAAGSGKTVAIVDAFDNPNVEADLANYRKEYGLPACTTANGCFRKVDQNGGTNYPAGDTGWGAEISLDVDMVSAICPNCNILLVEANSNGIGDLVAAEQQAAALGADAISNSWGASDNFALYSYDSAFEPGIAVTASSGDSGYGNLWPSVIPNVVSVGGTTLTADASARGWSEQAWSGAGSGCSDGGFPPIFGISFGEPKPSWQHDSGCLARTTADVSAVADPATAVAVYDTYGYSGWVAFGGTSVAAPIIASVYAMAGHSHTSTAPALPYAKPGNLFDVVGGSNGSCTPKYLCTAVAGYDGPTGLGTPNGLGAF